MWYNVWIIRFKKKYLLGEKNLLPISIETIRQNLWWVHFYEAIINQELNVFPALIKPKTHYRVSKTLVTESYINDFKKLRKACKFSHYIKNVILQP